MKLVEQGVIDLDTRLQDYVDEPLWANRGEAWHENLSDLRGDERYRRITARMCLSHTSGFSNWRWFEPDEKLRIRFDPGARYGYFGEGFTFLQIVLEKLTGVRLEQRTTRPGPRAPWRPRPRITRASFGRCCAARD